MKTFLTKKSVKRSIRGAALVEYAMVVIAVAFVAGSAARNVGKSTQKNLTDVKTEMDAR